MSYVEVLGYARISDQERRHFESFFAAATILPVSNEVLEAAVRLRQQRNMSLGDGLTAATALVHGLTLVTRNTKDFDWIAGLPLLNPFQT